MKKPWVSICFVLVYIGVLELSRTVVLSSLQVRSSLREPVDEEVGDSYDENDDNRHALEWTVKLDSNDIKVAREVASKYGFVHVSDIEGIDGLYRFIREPHVKKADHKDDEKSFEAAKEEIEKILAKRDHIESAKRLGEDANIKWIRRERYLDREKRAPIPEFSQLSSAFSEDNRKPKPYLNDPKFEQQWYINNHGQTSGPAHFDSHVLPVWKMGITGKGVHLSVLDDGMDHSHPDLVNQYDPLSSKDLNGLDDDPMPNDSDPYNAHGTKCSGTIAAEANNSICGVGIAFGAKVGAIRMLDGKATDGLEADALSFHRDHIDIYSCSWGPKDNGATFGRPGKLGRIALEHGVKFGRNGLGSLFIWATGNGGIMQDDCNADGYVNSIYTVGIGSANEYGVSTYYGEKCSAAMAVTYCSGQHAAGAGDEQANVITTYLHHQCTEHFVGTSSAAPLAAAIFALTLEANPRMTWRDIQHLVYATAERVSPLDPDWKKNGCGRWFNHKFGFGVLNAHKMVTAAQNWTYVSPQRACHFRLNFKNGVIPSGHHFKLNFTTDGCQSCVVKGSDGKCTNAIYHLEHVVVNVTLKHRCRGHLSIDLISPSGTVSHVLHIRPNDDSDAGLVGWSFMTVFNWCENPAGTWQLVFRDNLVSRLPETLEKKSEDMEEVYIGLLRRSKLTEQKKRAGRDDIGDDYDETKEGGFSEAQIERIQNYLREHAEGSAKDGDGERGKWVDAKRDVEGSERQRSDVDRRDDDDDRAGEGYDTRRELASGNYERTSLLDHYRRAQYEQARSLDRRAAVDDEGVALVDPAERHLPKRVEDADDVSDYPRQPRELGVGHKCDSGMKDPSLADSDAAGEVTDISVTMYGTG